jgi:hypothetical protein
MAHINGMGKLFGAAVAAWLGAKLVETVVERPAPRTNPLEGMMDARMQRDLQLLADRLDGVGFDAYLDRAGCPRDARTRGALWRHFSG